MTRSVKRLSAVLLSAVLCLAVPASAYASVVKKGGRVNGGSTSETQSSGESAASGSGNAGSSSANSGSTSANNGSTSANNSSSSANTGNTEGNGKLGANAGKDINAVIASAGLDALGTGNTPPDPILNQVQIVNYFLKDKDGNNIDFVASNENRGAVAADGFSRFYMIHDGVARFYYRTYTAQHGWTPWCASKETTPDYGDDSKVQAVQIRVKGYAHTLNDLYYKVVLNDGTVLDWAKNGQTTGTMGTDKYIVAIRVGLWHKTTSFPFKTKTLMAGCNYDGTYTDASGVVHYSSYNGQPYTGWGFVDNTQYYFVDGEHVTDWQYVDGYKYYFNADGSVATDLEPIMGLQGEYQINYNKGTRTMYILARDGDNGFIIPFKTFNTTCGPDTPLGDYATFAKYDVKFMHDDIYCKYLSRFYGGFLIHSILYYTSNLDLDAITYNYIDDAASGGCIRLLTGDACWVYSNCPMHTRVHIYEDPMDKGPIEKGAIDQVIPRDQTWDPTDPASADLVAQAAADAAAAQGDQTGSQQDAELVEALKSE